MDETPVVLEVTVNILDAETGDDLVAEKLVISDITYGGILSSLATWIAQRDHASWGYLPEAAYATRPASDWPRDQALALHPTWLAWLWIKTVAGEVADAESQRQLLEVVTQARRQLAEAPRGTLHGVDDTRSVEGE